MPALVNPTVVVNNVPIYIKPNSFSYTEGAGERKVRPKTSGPGAIKNVITEDVETQFSMVKFTLLSETEAVDFHKDWLDRLDQNTIQATLGDFDRTFNRAIITTDTEISFGQDGEFEIEFRTEVAG